MSQNAAAELLALNQKLLDSIVNGDWKTYTDLCDPALTAFEPEANGQLVQGLDFHSLLISSSNAAAPAPSHDVLTSRASSGRFAVLAYVRLTQSLEAGGNPVTSAVAGPRVWERKPSGWKHTHFHRSPC